MQLQYLAAFLSVCLNKRPCLLYAKVCVDIAVSVCIFTLCVRFFYRLLYVLLAVIMLNSVQIITFGGNTLQVCCIGSVEYLLPVIEKYSPTEIWHVVIQLHWRYFERPIIV